MALIRYVCVQCGGECLVFSGEEKSRLKQGNCSDAVRWCHEYKPLPPTPCIVHATNSFMSTELMLDSMWTVHDLNRQLNIEASEEKQIKQLNNFRISF